ncbi:aldehyde dehydrogenase family protein, partial [Burkholderia cenocepacia]|uniref:aldehyde dehydrogenase family protein n=1 Tax=Burkholderia cenocepacia TaxID=95486 RepID=UPI00406C5915
MGVRLTGARQHRARLGRDDVDERTAGERLAHVAKVDGDGGDRAVGRARHAFGARGGGGLRPGDRERSLLRLADLIEAEAETLAQLETLNQGE